MQCWVPRGRSDAVRQLCSCRKILRAATGPFLSPMDFSTLVQKGASPWFPRSSFSGPTEKWKVGGMNYSPHGCSGTQGYRCARPCPPLLSLPNSPHSALSPQQTFVASQMVSTKPAFLRNPSSWQSYFPRQGLPPVSDPSCLYWREGNSRRHSPWVPTWGSFVLLLRERRLLPPPDQGQLPLRGVDLSPANP